MFRWLERLYFLIAIAALLLHISVIRGISAASGWEAFGWAGAIRLSILFSAVTGLLGLALLGYQIARHQRVGMLVAATLLASGGLIHFAILALIN